MKLLTDLFDPNRSHGPMRSLKRPLYSWALSGGHIPEQLLVLPPDPWVGDGGRGRWVINRVVDYHGMHVSLESSAWADAKLARDPIKGPVIHSFEFLRDLRSLGGDQARRLGRTLMQEWMAENKHWRDGAWDWPVTGRRVASWLMGYEFFCSSADDEFLDSLYASLMRQVRHLDRADPATLHGMDALYVIRALVFAGLSLEGGEDRLEDALDWLDHWILTEIDGQGMHVSRSPSICVVAARILIDIRGALVRAGYASPTTLQAAIDRLMHSIRFFRLSDQKLACFHGGQEDDITQLDALFRVSGVKIRKSPTQLTDAGFESMTREKVTVIVDCGGPARSPHDRVNHASPLAFEMAVGRERLVVNCAAHKTDPVWEDHLRATAAHSTLVVDDRNAFEICKNGQFGRRATKMESRRDLVQHGIMFTASHDGYVPLNGLVHTRRLTLSTDGSMLEGEDILSCDAPLVKPTPFAVRFHLHPRVQASLIQEGQAILLRMPSGQGWRFYKEGADLSLEPSIYCGADGNPRKTMQIVLSGQSDGAGASVRWQFTEER